MFVSFWDMRRGSQVTINTDYIQAMCLQDDGMALIDAGNYTYVVGTKVYDQLLQILGLKTLD